jgi:hypothetical protein
MLKLDSFICSSSDLELSKMTLRDLGPQTLVSKNMLSTTSNSDDRFKRYELGRTDNGDSILPPKFVRAV